MEGDDPILHTASNHKLDLGDGLGTKLDFANCAVDDGFPVISS